ncbi:condensation protein [Streptomyces sp. H27-D2]|uniref:condensation protein n=1 Tax=Streptomyces sp. H27-D2 TaxID=3046304 RepID=UPI002DB5F517|nr:condensation protein [Streptomyces sp. H27-D2]MEC4016151.1 condensation protein [Streptomyces sp. H27-D2]
MTALHNRPGTPRVHRIPFPTVDEVTRHCAQEEEPETVHIEVHLPGRLEPDRLRAAFGEALRRHPRVLMREVPGSWWRRRYEWQLTGAPDTDPVSFPKPGPDALATARERALAICPPLDSAPPIRLEAIVGGATGEGEGTVLVITINHTALDGPACLRILATAAELYARGGPNGGTGHAASPPPEAPADTPAVAPYPGPTAVPAPSSTPGLGLTRPARIAPDTHRARVGNAMRLLELPVPARPPRTTVTPVPYTVNDQLLVAACLMSARWNRLHDRPSSPVRITMPVDDRPRGTTEMPIGNGTRLVEVGFGPEERADATLLTADTPHPAAVSRLLHRTAERTRALKAAPRAQLGPAGALLTAPVLPVGLRGTLTRGVRRVAAPWASTTLVSNIGRIAYPLDFGDAGLPTAVWFSAPARMPRGLTVTTVSVDGRLHVALRWSRALLDDEAGATLGAIFSRSLAATSWSPS